MPTPKLFKKFMWSATPQGDNVVLRMGNANIEMGYEDALRMSQALRVAGKQAKAHAGDVSRHWSVIANLGTQESNYEQFTKPNLRYSGVNNGH